MTKEAFEMSFEMDVELFILFYVAEMTLYGLCPAQDEFFLVICEYCHLLIKPQALQYHMGTIYIFNRYWINVLYV